LRYNAQHVARKTNLRFRAPVPFEDNHITLGRVRDYLPSAAPLLEGSDRHLQRLRCFRQEYRVIRMFQYSHPFNVSAGYSIDGNSDPRAVDTRSNFFV